MPGGRKTKYTPERVQKITQAIALGATQRLACLYAGVGHTAFHEWMERKPEFAEAVKEAEGRGAIGWLAKIEKAANDDTWQAAAWKLERRYPQEYGKQVQEVQGKDGAPLLPPTQPFDFDAFARSFAGLVAAGGNLSGPDGDPEPLDSAAPDG